MTAMFIITFNKKTPQSLRRHSCLPLRRRQNNGGLLKAHSGRSCDKMAVSVNRRGRGMGLCDVTLPRIGEQLDLRHCLLFEGI